MIEVHGLTNEEETLLSDELDRHCSGRARIVERGSPSAEAALVMTGRDVDESAIELPILYGTTPESLPVRLRAIATAKAIVRWVRHRMAREEYYGAPAEGPRFLSTKS